MKWGGRNEQDQPKSKPVERHRRQVPDTCAPNIEPAAFRMEGIDVISSRRDKRLHAVIACRKNTRAQDVDN